MATDILSPPAPDEGATPPSDSAQDKLSAAGYLFGEIASHVYTATEVLHEAIGDPDSAAALASAVCALLDKIGAMADRAALACGELSAQGQDDWLLSPRGNQAMAALEEGATQ